MNLSHFTGLWYIVFSNFPMWTKGDKLYPTFNYSIATKNGIEGLSDEVKYEKNAKLKSIKGWDKPINKDFTKFEWRGSGLLFIAKSQWEVVYMDRSQEWMLIKFEKTLFTPAGYDVVCRDPKQLHKIKNQILRKLSDLGITDLTEISQIKK